MSLDQPLSPKYKPKDRQVTSSYRKSLVIGIREILPGLFALLLSVPVAIGISIIHRLFPTQPEKAVLLILGLFFLILVFSAAVYLVKKKSLSKPAELVLILFTTSAILLVGIYLYRVSILVRLPADILIWSESDFVNDILKFRQGYPIFTDQSNNESFTYMPGPQLLTYFFAFILGRSTSIPFYRMIQIGFTLIATLGAYFCGRLILKIGLPNDRKLNWNNWSMIWLPVLFLIATNSLTNPFVHNLHDDSLAQLVFIIAYLLLLAYIYKQDNRLLILMAFIPALGFMVKQSIVVWGLVYCLHLVFFDRPFSIKKLVLFAAASFGLLGVTVLICYYLWGQNFIYWIFTVLGSHGVSPLRSFQHLLDVWLYYAMGIFGGLVLLRGKALPRLLSPWLVWLIIIGVQTYTSGIAWMTNHIGPGSLIAGVWFLSGLTRIWPAISRFTQSIKRQVAWLRTSMVLVLMTLVLSGLGVVRIPISPLPNDAYRYIDEIEQEFKQNSSEDVLLDAGTWIYLSEGVIMKDRAATIGERGYSDTGDFSAFINRIQEQKYSKILVRNLNEPEFWYDNYLWPKSAGIRDAILKNYEVTSTIPEVEGVNNYLFDEISILEPIRR